MKRHTIGYIASLVLGGVTYGQELPTPVKPLHVEDRVTHHIGELNDKTQGVIQIYGADWCGPCNELEALLIKDEDNNPKTPTVAERIAQKGIAIQFIRNQYPNQEKNKGVRINEHLQKDKEHFRKNLNGIPYLMFIDFGRSNEKDTEEIAMKGVKAYAVKYGPKFIENYARRYILDERISMLSEEELKKTKEAIASDLFNVSYGVLYQDGITKDVEAIGFSFIPKNRNDSKTKELEGRLSMRGPSVALGKEKQTLPYTASENIPSQEQLDAINVNPLYKKYFEDECRYLEK